MSILLDSLRKSEAQRVMGDAPSIYSDGYAAHAGRSSNHWLSWLLIGSAFAVMSWFGLQQYAPPEDPEGAVTQAQSTGDEPPDLISEQPSQRTPPNDTDGETVRTPVEEVDRAPTRVDRRSLASPDGSWALLAEDVATYTPPEASETAVDDPNMQVATESQPGADTSDPIEELEQVARAQPAEVVPGTSAISYWSLPQSVRDSLGELKITVLVYDDKPEKRFLLLNGERLREKDPVAGGAVLQEIRREGAVFTYRNYRFLVAN